MLKLELVMKKLGLLIMIMWFGVEGKGRNYGDYVNGVIGSECSYEFCWGNRYGGIGGGWGMKLWRGERGKMGEGWEYMYSGSKMRGFKERDEGRGWINE